MHAAEVSLQIYVAARGGEGRGWDLLWTLQRTKIPHPAPLHRRVSKSVQHQEPAHDERH